MTQNELFMVRFNFQNMLRIKIDNYDYARIANVLNLNEMQVKEAINSFENINQLYAEELKKKYPIDLIKNIRTDIIFVGDSITSDRLSYMNILKKVLCHNSNISFMDSSVSGWRSGDILQEFYSSVFLNKADTVIYALGTNDMRTISGKFCVTSEEEYNRNVNRTLQSLSNYKLIVNTLPPVDNERAQNDYGEMGWSFTEENRHKFNRILIKAAKNNNAVINDTQALFEEHIKNNINVFYEDGVHINEVGQKIIAENLLKIFLEVL